MGNSCQEIILHSSQAQPWRVTVAKIGSMTCGYAAVGRRQEHGKVLEEGKKMAMAIMQQPSSHSWACHARPALAVWATRVMQRPNKHSEPLAATWACACACMCTMSILVLVCKQQSYLSCNAIEDLTCWKACSKIHASRKLDCKLHKTWFSMCYFALSANNSSVSAKLSVLFDFCYLGLSSVKMSIEGGKLLVFLSD